MSECYSTETKILTLTCLQLLGQLSYADRATGHKSTVRAAATAMRVKRDGENASVVDGYGGEEVDGTDGCVSEGRRTTKGKDSAASHLPRAEVEDRTPDSRLNRSQCAVGLESTRFESWFAETTENRWTGQMDQTG